METPTVEGEEHEVEQIPICPSCGSKCVRETKELKAARITVRVWVCPTQKTKSCL